MTANEARIARRTRASIVGQGHGPAMYLLLSTPTPKAIMTDKEAETLANEPTDIQEPFVVVCLYSDPSIAANVEHIAARVEIAVEIALKASEVAMNAGRLASMTARQLDTQADEIRRLERRLDEALKGNSPLFNSGRFV